jgi:transposase
MGSTLNMNLDHGRSRRGERVYDENPTAPGETINIITVLTEHGLEAVDMYRESLTARRFVFYLSIYLIPLLTDGKVLIMDNHPVHRARLVVKFLEDQKIRYIYLPPYSPELNPIEEAFSKAKHYIKGHKPRDLGDLAGTIEGAIKTITQDDIIGYVNHAEEFLDVTC